jgi:CubicO group peptidase (beta-lactamase class C family)
VTEGELRRLLEEHSSQHSVPGAALGVLRGATTMTTYCGVADTTTGEPVTAKTRFAIGSLGKAMVATAVAHLAAEGRLAFDDRVAAHVPELSGAEWAERATLRDLMANRSGLPLLAGLEFADFEGDDDDVLSRFASSVARHEPAGLPWSYTNAGWCLLGRAIETVTGLTWEDAMAANVLAPLRMGQTTFAIWPAAEPRASGHGIVDGRSVPVERWTPRALGPAGSTPLSTVTDMLRFAQAHLDDSPLAGLRVTQAEVRIAAWLDAWCLGWARFDWDAGPVWGWDGLVSGDRAILRLLPEQGGAVVLLTNGERGRALYRSLFPELVNSLFGVGMPALRLEPSPPAAGDLARFAGSYAWPDRCLEVSATDAALMLESEQETVEAVALDERTFLVDADDPDNPTVTFGAFDESGRPGVLYEMLWGLPRV